MHIGLFSPAPPTTDTPNGIVTYVRYMRAALRALGHRVTVISYNGIERTDGVIDLLPDEPSLMARIRNAARRFKGVRSGAVVYATDVARKVLAVHRSDPFDVFEMEESFGWVGSLRLGVPVIARLHGPHFLGKDEAEAPQVAPLSEVRIAAEGKAIATVSGVTSPSRKLAEQTFRKYNLAGVYSATILNPMPIAPEDRRWTIDHCDPNTVLFAGRFDLRKGADVALKAFTIAAMKHTNLRLIMCGPDSGIIDEMGFRVHFAEYAEQNVPKDVRSRIHFLGSVSFDEVEQMRLKSSLFLSTSRFETFGYSIAESLAVGMPVLTSDTFGIPEFLEHRVNGYIAPVGRADLVAATILEALSDRQNLAIVGAAGRKLCEDLLNPEKLARDTIEFYEKAMLATKSLRYGA